MSNRVKVKKNKVVGRIKPAPCDPGSNPSTKTKEIAVWILVSFAGLAGLLGIIELIGDLF